MQEMARQQYLDAMGIQTYMPKWVLSSAPVPLQCDLADVCAGSDNVGSRPAARPQVVLAAPQDSANAASASTPELAGDILQAMLSGAKAADTTKPASKANNLSLIAKQQLLAAQDDAFAVNLWQFTGLIIVADRLVQKALPVTYLLKNILVALGRSVAEAQKPEVIKWPLDGLSAAQSGPADTYLKSILLARRFAGQPTTLLCFGSMSSKNLLPDGAVCYAQSEVILSDAEAMPAVALPSLEALIEAPEKKAQVWAAISHLRIA